MNRAVWTIALSLVAKHDATATRLLHAHIMGLRRRLAKTEVIDSWLMVDQAVHELVRTAPKQAETIH